LDASAEESGDQYNIVQYVKKLKRQLQSCDSVTCHISM